MNILVTGQPGVGKTTLIMKVFERLKEAYPQLAYQGFYTEEVRRGGERIGFDVVTLGGRRAPLSRVDGAVQPPPPTGPTGSAPRKAPMVGKYAVDIPQFELLALPELEIGASSSLCVIDEVGKMELLSGAFFPAVLKALDSPCPVLASIPVPRYGRDIPQVASVRLRKDVTLHTLSRANRDMIADEIFAELSLAVSKNGWK